MVNPNAYTLTTKDGTKYRYDQNEGLQYITDRNGITVTFSDTGITHSIAGSIEFVRDTRGRITQVIAPAPTDGADPIRVQYRYDSAGNLATVTDPLGDTTQYEYLPILATRTSSTRSTTPRASRSSTPSSTMPGGWWARPTPWAAACDRASTSRR